MSKSETQGWTVQWMPSVEQWEVFDESRCWVASAEAEKIAHLIAAAPELYEALEHYVTHAKMGIHPSRVRAAKKLLKRARGES